jgi:iron complex transport system ATP-binding protein
MSSLLRQHQRYHQHYRRLHGVQQPDLSAPAVELEELAFSYGKRPFIQDFSASFARGSITSIVGPNGCGKSTLIKLMDGLLPAHVGSVRIEGVDTLALTSKERARRMAVLAQAARPPAMSVYDLVACGRYPYHGHQGNLDPIDREKIEEALVMAGIEHFRDHDLRRLSGGERQKAFIAMVLAQDTSLVLLDEPTTYLDITACHELMALITRLHSEMDKTIVMVIHDLDLALRYSEHMLVMSNGCNTFHGTVEEVLASKALETAFNMRIREYRSEEGVAHVLFPQ